MTKPLCRPHYFVVAPPHGPTSLGRCQKCGRERQFRNSPEEVSTKEWNNGTLFTKLPNEPFWARGGDEAYEVYPEILMR